MCGFTGFIDFNKKTGADVLSAMAGELLHRGPDDSGADIFSLPAAEVGFGFRRLSIIDLSEAGHQPMITGNGAFAIIFNGEIYNYAEVKKELLSAGVKFKSDTDTEVILQSYIKWGKDCVQKFIGMFAFAIFDKEKQQVMIFRDRAGVKPLFYYEKDGLILFGSELKSFHKHPSFQKKINHSALALFMQNGYIPAPYTIFENTHKLKPGHRLIIDLQTRKIIEENYWNVIDFYNKPIQISFSEAQEKTEQLLASAFNYRMVADVPVGVFLSGGIDSSLVTAILQKDRAEKLKTFTIGFQEAEFNEATYARKVAEYLGTDHHEYFCTSKEAQEIIPDLPFYYDEPFADSSAIPTILVSRFARKQVTVALSADGGDEIFAGYTKYIKVLKYLDYLQKSPALVKKLSRSLLSFVPNPPAFQHDRIEKLTKIFLAKDPVKAFDIITQGMTFKEAGKYLKQPINSLATTFDEGHLFEKNVSNLNKFLATDYKTYMVDDILQKVDRATMSVSLEGREPFLDHRIIEFAAGLPAEFKLRESEGKYLLKQIAYKHLPKELIDRPKMGFRIPIEKWCRNELREIVEENLDEIMLQKQGVFNVETVKQLKQEFFKGNSKTDFERLWKILMFQMWYKRWMN
jgi:asparagine synthase (glutamine-hydrolysing)